MSGIFPSGRWAALGIAVLFTATLFSATLRADSPERWFAFAPGPVADSRAPGFDLRWLNESVAGEHGFVTARDGQFWLGDSGQPVRFWGVNGLPESLHGDALRAAARMLAAYGVNLVRIHKPIFNERGELDHERVRHTQEIVRAMKAEGIYTHLSVYFPLWFKPTAELEWLAGYDGNQHPFAALLFNPDFQQRYREWVAGLLTTPDPITGQGLIDEPAVFGMEIQNEDSFFFWTFNERNLPEPQMQLLESKFADWLKRRYGSLENCFERWGSAQLPRDAIAQNRVAMRPLWNIAHERTRRDQDTAAFLWETQTGFYRDTYQWLRQLGFKGMIHGSNWTTADSAVLTPLEKLSYTTGDFLDRHGYFSCALQGEFAAWSLRADYTYRDRSSLRLEAGDAPGSKTFNHPATDTQYDDKPSIISETTYERPNRFRSEAPLFFASYSALQDTDAVIHFALDGVQWQVKPNFWMQPWTLASPAMLGQFPAAALIYRQGLIAPGEVVADIRLNRDQLLQLSGTPLHTEADFDGLRAADLPADAPGDRQSMVHPALHYIGRTQVQFSEQPPELTLTSLQPYFDPVQQTITSSTGELILDYGRGILRIDAPKVQAVSGDLRAATDGIALKDVTIRSPLDLIHVVVVSLDGQPISQSQRMLLQVMSEEQNSGYSSERMPDGRCRITNLGTDPWQVRELVGAVSFHRADAGQLIAQPLDHNGQPSGDPLPAASLQLLPQTLYYLIQAPPTSRPSP
jgi:hypothetical protein